MSAEERLREDAARIARLAVSSAPCAEQDAHELDIAFAFGPGSQFAAGVSVPTEPGAPDHQHEWGHWQDGIPHEPMPTSGPLWDWCRICRQVRPPQPVPAPEPSAPDWETLYTDEAERYARLSNEHAECAPEPSAPEPSARHERFSPPATWHAEHGCAECRRWVLAATSQETR